MADAHDAVLRQRRQLQRDAGGQRQRPLGPDQQVRVVRILGQKLVEVVAADPALDLGEDRLDIGAVLAGKGCQAFHDPACTRGQGGQRRLAQREALAVGQHPVDRQHIVHHLAKVQRARPGRVVPRHPPDGAARGRRGLDREEQPVLAKLVVQRGQDRAGADADRSGLRVIVGHAVEMPRHVKDQPVPDRLAVLRGAAAPRDDRHAMFARDLKGRGDVALVPGEGHGARHDLVDRGIRRIAPAREGVKAHFAFERLAKRGLEGLAARGRRGAGLGGCVHLPVPSSCGESRQVSEPSD